MANDVVFKLPCLSSSSWRENCRDWRVRIAVSVAVSAVFELHSLNCSVGVQITTYSTIVRDAATATTFDAATNTAIDKFDAIAPMPLPQTYLFDVESMSNMVVSMLLPIC